MSGIIAAGKYTPVDFNRTKAVTMPQWAREWLREGAKKNPAQNFTKSPWANRCITIRMNSLAQIEWTIERPSRDDAGNPVMEAVDENHPAYVVLSEVNPEMNYVDLIRATSADLDIFARAYWLKVEKKHLMRLNPSTMKNLTDEKEGLIGFEQRLPKSQEPKRFEREEIVYFHHYDPNDDFGGISRTQVAQSAIEVDAFADEYIIAFFENYAMPPILISPKDAGGAIPDTQISQFRRTWDRFFKGSEKQHKAALLPKPVDVEIIGYPLKDLALEQVRAEARRSICAVYGVPPAIAGAWEAANYATVQEQRLSMYQDEVIPLSSYLAGVINAELLPDFDANLRFRFKTDELPIMQPNANDEASRIELLVRAGIITVEAGAKELGYTEEQIGEGPSRPPQFGGFSPPEKKEEKEEEKSGLKVDLEKWCRKAMKRAQAGKSALCNFESEHIPLALGEAISASLEEVESKDEVKALFASITDYEDMPYVRKENVDQKHFEAIMAAIAANKGIEIKAENLTVTQEIDPPEMQVMVAKQDPPVVNVEAPVINVEAPETPEIKSPEIIVNVPEQPTPQVNIENKIDIPKQTGSKRKVKRDKRGFVESIDEETLYE